MAVLPHYTITLALASVTVTAIHRTATVIASPSSTFVLSPSPISISSVAHSFFQHQYQQHHKYQEQWP
jgi:hypothetical protein